MADPNMPRITRRQAFTVGTCDVLVVALVADAVRNAVASEDESRRDFEMKAE